MGFPHDREPAVSFRDVHYRYQPDESEALAGVTLQIMEGEHVAVIGANGSGKSTLARHINALLVPDTGTVTVAGLDTADARHTYRVRRWAGLVFQNPDDQMVASVVRDDVAFGPENLGLPVAEIVTRVDDALATVGMSEHADDDVSALSGGQRQRVAIAGVLAMRPSILLLDEPGAMLDPRGRRGIRRVSRELHEAGMTVIVITQHMDEALVPTESSSWTAAASSVMVRPRRCSSRWTCSARLDWLCRSLPPSPTRCVPAASTCR